jgi:hypothetical protein
MTLWTKIPSNDQEHTLIADRATGVAGIPGFYLVICDSTASACDAGFLGKPWFYAEDTGSNFGQAYWNGAGLNEALST